MEYYDYENLGRNKFQELCNSYGFGIEFTRNRYDNLDGFFYYGSYRGAVEIKNRFSNYSSWKIDVHKYYAMEEELINGRSNSGCFAFFYNDELWLYDFIEVKKWKESNGTCTMRARGTTYGNSPYVEKEVLDLPKNIAIHYKKLNNTWTKC